MTRSPTRPGTPPAGRTGSHRATPRAGTPVAPRSGGHGHAPAAPRSLGHAPAAPRAGAHDQGHGHAPARAAAPSTGRTGRHLLLPAPKALPPPCLRGFEAINRFWDGNVRAWTAQILPGEFYVTTTPNEIITTVLGSCVAACIRDPIMSVGGMNHFMLPEAPSGHADGASARYGGYAIERLINEILKHGGRRDELELKIFGGGRIIEGLSDIGASNITFVRDYADAEGIAIVAEDVGGRFARRVRYHAHSGHVAVKRLPMLEAREVVSKEQQLRQRLAQQAKGGEVELF